MIRGCDVCGRPYEATRVSSRFCSGTCRKRNLRAPRPRLAETSPAAEDYALLAATRAELEAAGRLDSMLGQVALLFAERMCEFDTGSGTTALSKELRAVMAAAVQGAPAAADPVDELRAGGTGNAAHKAGPRDDYERNDSHVHTSSSNVELDLVVTQLRGTPDIGYHREHGAPVGPSRYTAPGWCEAPGLASNLSAGYPPSVSEPVAQRPLAGPVGPA